MQAIFYVACFFTLVLFFVRQTKLLAIVIIAGLFCGWYRFYNFDGRLHKYDQIIENNPRLEAVVAYVQQKVVKNGKQRLVLRLRERGLGSYVQAAVPQFPEFSKGDFVTLDCELTKPQPFEGFAYDKYLATQGIYLICDNAWIEKSDFKIEFVQDPLEFLRLKIMGKIEKLWAKPSSSLVAGLLLGSRESFPQSTLDSFSRSGITHIIALSGFNITILIVFLEKILINVLVPLRVRLMIIILGITIFTVFVGAGASIMRAALMGGIVLVSKYIGRQADPWRILLFSAAIMVFTQPFVLLYDVGFQLSFMATIGLLYLTGFFQRIFAFVPNLLDLRESLTTTMAATVMTLPLTMRQFGTVSIISPLANMLILPTIPILMALGGTTVLIPCRPLVWLVDAGCQYILEISSLLASINWAAASVILPFWLMIIFYLLLICLIIYETKKT